MPTVDIMNDVFIECNPVKIKNKGNTLTTLSSEELKNPFNLPEGNDGFKSLLTSIIVIIIFGIFILLSILALKFVYKYIKGINGNAAVPNANVVNAAVAANAAAKVAANAAAKVAANAANAKVMDLKTRMDLAVKTPIHTY